MNIVLFNQGICGMECIKNSDVHWVKFTFELTVVRKMSPENSSSVKMSSLFNVNVHIKQAQLTVSLPRPKL